MKLRCRLEWHEWTPWSESRSEVITVITVSFRGNKVSERETLVQVRRCMHCNLEEMREVNVE